MMKLPIYPSNCKTPFSMLVVVTSLTMLTGCATLSAPDPILMYQCDSGTHLEVQLRSKYVSYMRGARNTFPRIERRTAGANVILGDGTVLDLTTEKVASGFQISDGYHTLWSKDGSATWTVGNTIEHCQLHPLSQ